MPHTFTVDAVRPNIHLAPTHRDNVLIPALDYRPFLTWTGTSSPPSWTHSRSLIQNRIHIQYLNTSTSHTLSTLIDSTPGVFVAWDIFAKDYGLDSAAAAHASHGRRLYDTLKELCHITDEAKLLVSLSLSLILFLFQPDSGACTNAYIWTS